MLGDWEESKRLITKHPFNGMIVKSMSSSAVNINATPMFLHNAIITGQADIHCN